MADALTDTAHARMKGPSRFCCNIVELGYSVQDTRYRIQPKVLRTPYRLWPTALRQSVHLKYRKAYLTQNHSMDGVWMAWQPKGAVKRCCRSRLSQRPCNGRSSAQRTYQSQGPVAYGKRIIIQLLCDSALSVRRWDYRV